MDDDKPYQLKAGEEIHNGLLLGWTGNPCSRCKGTGELLDVVPCPDCGGTGDEYGTMPVQPVNLPKEKQDK